MRNETDVSFFLVSEDDSILLRRMDDVVDTGPDEHHRAIGEMADQMFQHFEMAQIQFTKLLMSLLRYSDKFRREPPRPRHPNALAQWLGECQLHDRTGENASTRTSKAKPLPNTAVQKPRLTVSIHLELDGLDDVADDAFKVEYGKADVSLTTASVAGKQRIFKLTGLAHQITGVKDAKKKRKQKVSP